MKYADLRDFLQQLERMKELRRVKVEVSPQLEVTEVCSDGSRTSFRKRYQIPELGPPGNRSWLVRVESWTNENLETRRRHRAGMSALVHPPVEMCQAVQPAPQSAKRLQD